MLLPPVTYADAATDSAPANRQSGQQPSVQPVYKYTDEYGRVSYSYTLPRDAVETEEIVLVPGPSRSSVEQYMRQQARIADTARMLDTARKQREAAREEAESKRLERLSRPGQVRRPPADNETRLYIGYPWKPWRGRPGGHYRDHAHCCPGHHDERSHRQSRLPLPGSSFPGR